MVAEFGFYITQVRLTGNGVDPAQVDLKDGFNVIFGASNTGKTYISQCIDFALGRSDRPKDIPEARVYDTVHVGLRSRRSNDAIRLRRSLRGGDIAAIIGESTEKTLSATHSDKNTENVSSVLLELCGLAGRRVTENARGKTRSLSFRDLSRLVIINEEVIIKSESPIRSRAYTENTLRQSVFRLLLSGSDDSSVVETKELKVSRAESRGKGEILADLESEIREKISAYESDESVDNLTLRKVRLDASIEAISSSLSDHRASHGAVEQQRRQVWARLQQVESRQEVLSQLQQRFTLLSAQYESDIERLASIAEVGTRLNELREERCPVCGALAENHSVEHSERDASPEIVAAAAAAESEKVQVLMADLADTITETREESEQLGAELVELESTLGEVTQRLQREYQPRVAAILEEYQQAVDERSRLSELLEFHERLERIVGLRVVAETPPPTSDVTVVTKVSSAQAEVFCHEVERLLKEWQLPDVGRVSFSEESQDIVIAGRDRSVDGKGVRALTHAAFSLSLNNYCVDQDLPSPSFVILDSPLVVYRKPDDGERNFSPDVKANFYRQLALESAGRQVIILENDDPPSDLEESVNVLHFTRSDHGRYGFIPVQSSSGGRKVGTEPE